MESLGQTRRRTNQLINLSKQFRLDYLFQEVSTKYSICIALGIAAIFTLRLFPLSFLFGKSGLFNNLEPSQSLSGWWSFKSHPWTYPFLNTRLLNSPGEVNIAVTNSLPLLAVPFKILRNWLPKDFHYFGWWFVIAYCAQAISATLVLRTLEQRTVLAACFSSIMSLMMPVLLWQSNNIPLAGQAYLLLALNLYFLALQQPKSFLKFSKFFAVILGISLLTHPYLCMMTGTFYLASLVEYWKSPSYNQSVAITSLAWTGACVSILLVAGGYLNQSIFAKGYGMYSMNVLAPVSGGKLGKTLVYVTSGQHRGFNYLGAGTWISILFTLFNYRNNLKVIISRHSAMLTLLSILTVLSLSHRVYWGKINILNYPLFFPISLLGGMFQSSGRLFWPCGYTLMILGLTGVLNHKDKTLSLATILAITAIQYYDTSALRHSLSLAARKPPIRLEQWDPLIRSVSHINVYPAYLCGKNSPQEIAFWQVAAARQGRTINTAYISRAKANCFSQQLAFNRPIKKGQLYVTSNSTKFLPKSIVLAKDQGWCRKTSQGLVCIKNSDEKFWNARLPFAEKLQKHKPARKRNIDLDWPEE